jgi:hypothetical protein
MRLNKIISVFSLAALLSGCENVDRLTATDFAPSANGRFRYKGYADAIYTVDSAEAEQRRLRMLDEWLRLNGECKNGYEIISRKPVRRSQGLLGSVYDVWYDGRCKA